jgi:DNA-binding transcriptional LysR family regulator
MELRHLRYFVAVAEELHFGRAGQRLHLAQPALSQQIKQLEQELGVLLLFRTKRSVALTEPGRAFLTEARRTLESADQAVRAARRASRGEIGTLRVGYVDLATWLGFPAILRQFRQRFPSVDVTLVELHREPQREALVRGDLDVGFFTLSGRDNGLAGVPIASEPLVVALPADHPRTADPRLALADLAEENWVLFPRDLRTVYVELILSHCRTAGFVPRIVQEASQLHALAGLVSAGVGITMLPRAMAAAPRQGVVYRPLEDAPVLPLHLVWPERNQSPAAIQFVEVARGLIGEPAVDPVRLQELSSTDDGSGS